MGDSMKRAARTIATKVGRMKYDNTKNEPHGTLRKEQKKQWDIGYLALSEEERNMQRNKK
eukprot:scaffold1758_cov40-Cyclotella_meneghiniana.AAC.11